MSTPSYFRTPYHPQARTNTRDLPAFLVIADSFRDMNLVKDYTPSPKAISEELAHKVNSFDPMAENHDELMVEWDGDSTVSSEWSIIKTPEVDVTDPFDKFSVRPHNGRHRHHGPLYNGPPQLHLLLIQQPNRHP